MYWEDTFRSRTLSHSSGKKQLFPKKKTSRTLSRKVFLIGLFLLAQIIVYNCDLFKLKEVSVRGNSKTRAADILDAAAFPLNKNLFEISLAGARERCRKLHWIRTISLHKKYPASISLAITEREPVILIRCRGGDGSTFLADNEGMILEAVRGSKTKGSLPLLEVRDKLQIGRKIHSEKVKAALACYAWLPGMEHRKVRSVYINSKFSIIVFCEILGSPTTIYLGEDDNFTPKTARILSAIIKWCEDKGKPVKYINLKYPEKPALLWQNAGEVTSPRIEISN